MDEERALRKNAAAKEIQCEDCRMKFATDAELHRHRRFCGGPIAAQGQQTAPVADGMPEVDELGSKSPKRHREAPSISRNTLRGYLAARGTGHMQDTKDGFGATTLLQLQRSVNSASLADLQAQAMQEEQQALASKLRAYKLSAVLPSRLQGRSIENHARADGGAKEVNCRGVGIQVGNGKGDGRAAGDAGAGSTRQRPPSEQPSISALLAKYVLAEQEACGVLAPSLVKRDGQESAAARRESREEAAAEAQSSRMGRKAKKWRREQEGQKNEMGPSEQGMKIGRRKLYSGGEQDEDGGWEREKARLLEEKVQALANENNALKRERDLIAENGKLKRQLQTRMVDGRADPDEDVLTPTRQAEAGRVAAVAVAGIPEHLVAADVGSRQADIEHDGAVRSVGDAGSTPPDVQPGHAGGSDMRRHSDAPQHLAAAAAAPFLPPRAHDQVIQEGTVDHAVVHARREMHPGANIMDSRGISDGRDARWERRRGEEGGGEQSGAGKHGARAPASSGDVLLGEAAVRAQQHSLEMMRLEHDTARLTLVKELVEMQDAMAKRRQKVERDAWLEKQRRALQEAQQLRSSVLPGSSYDPVQGFKLRFDVLQPLPRGAHQTQLVYGLYDGPSALMPLQSSPTRDLVMDVKPDGGRRTWISHVRTFKKLPPTQDVVCIVEVQDVATDGISQSVGWTVIPLFDEDHRLLDGAWRAPLLEPPVKLQLTSTQGLRDGARFDLLKAWPRVMVEEFGGLHGGQAAVGKVEAMLFVRLRACQPAPSPDDLDYETKMAELASRSRNEWSPIDMSEYQTAHVFVDAPCDDPIHLAFSGSAAQDGGTGPDNGQEGKEGKEDGMADAGKGARGDAQVKIDGTEGAYKGRKDGAVRVRGEVGADGSMAGLDKEAWTQGVTDDALEADADAGGAAFAHVGPDDELLVILDAARFLPDNVSISYATMSLIKPDGSQVTIPSASARDAFGIPNARAQGMANLDSPLHSPTFQLSCSFRVRHCDPSSTVVVRIDALDVHAPTGSPAVCVGYACFGLFRDLVSGRALTLEQGAEFVAAIDQVEAEARRAKLETASAQVQSKMPKIRVVRGGWQVPLRSTWPLRALWKDKPDKAAGSGAGVGASAGAQLALNRFVGEDTNAQGPAGHRRQANARGKEDDLEGGKPALDSSNDEPARIKLARKLVERSGGGEDEAVEVRQRLDSLAPMLVQDLPRLPCASLLLRVLVNPSEADMMTVLKHAGHTSLLDEIDIRSRDLARKQRAAREADVDEEEAVLREEELFMRAAIVRTKPQYAKGFYNSQATVPSGVERAMLPHKLASVRRDLCGRDVLRQLLPASLHVPIPGDAHASNGQGGEQDGDGEGGEARWLERAEAALFLVKKRPKVAATRPPAVDDGRVDKRDDDGVYAVGGALDLSLMCAYNPALGFQVAIDGAINLKVEKGPKGELVWPVAVAGVVPASSYFAGDAAGLLAAHTWFVSNISPASTLKCPRWQEGIKHVYGLPFLGHRAALLVQVLGMSRGEVERGTRTVTQVSSVAMAWTAMPLFLDHRLPYVIDGSFQLPLYAGAVPPTLAGQIQEAGCEEALRAHEVDNKAALMPAASLLVRVVDVQRGATSNGHLAAGGMRNPVPPTDVGLAQDVSSDFLRTWPSLALSGQPVQRIPPKKLQLYFKASSNGLFAGRGADPLVSALLLKMHQDDAKDTGSGSVHGSMVGGAADGDGGGAKNEGVSIARLHAMLRSDTAGVTHLVSLADQGLE